MIRTAIRDVENNSSNHSSQRRATGNLKYQMGNISSAPEGTCNKTSKFAIKTKFDTFASYRENALQGKLPSTIKVVEACLGA